MSRKTDLDNRSNQLNPNNDAYQGARGRPGEDEYEDDQSSESTSNFHRSVGCITETVHSARSAITFEFPPMPVCVTLDYVALYPKGLQLGTINVEGPNMAEVLQMVQQIWQKFLIVYLRCADATAGDPLLLKERPLSGLNEPDATEKLQLAKTYRDGTYKDSEFSIHPFTMPPQMLNVERLEEHFRRCCAA